MPGLDVPMIGGERRWRWQNKHARVAQSFVLLARRRFCAHHFAPAIETGESQDVRPGFENAGLERRNRLALRAGDGGVAAFEQRTPGGAPRFGNRKADDAIGL